MNPRCAFQAQSRFNNAKRYGCIESKDGTGVFVYFSAIQGEVLGTIIQVQPVDSEIVQGSEPPNWTHDRK
jgi:cold shock CspA family protein